MSSAHHLISSCHVISSHATISYLPHHVTRWHARRDGWHAWRDGWYGWYGWYGGPGRPGRRSTAAATAEGYPAEEGPHTAQGAKGRPPLASHNPPPRNAMCCQDQTPRQERIRWNGASRQGALNKPTLKAALEAAMAGSGSGGPEQRMNAIGPIIDKVNACQPPRYRPSPSFSPSPLGHRRR